MAGLTSVAATAHPLRDSDGQASLADRDRMGTIGDEITNRLFLAGLELCSALGIARDEAVRVRLEQAVAEVDDAIKDLRQLMLIALAGPPCGETGET